MADQQSSQQVTDERSKQQYDEQRQQYEDQKRQADQRTFDQMTGGFAGLTAFSGSPSDAWQSYQQLSAAHFQLARQVLDTAQRVADVQTLTLMRHTIVEDIVRSAIPAVTQQVLAAIKSEQSIRR